MASGPYNLWTAFQVIVASGISGKSVGSCCIVSGLSGDESYDVFRLYGYTASIRFFRIGFSDGFFGSWLSRFFGVPVGVLGADQVFSFAHDVCCFRAIRSLPCPVAEVCKYCLCVKEFACSEGSGLKEISLRFAVHAPAALSVLVCPDLVIQEGNGNAGSQSEDKNGVGIHVARFAPGTWGVRCAVGECYGCRRRLHPTCDLETAVGLQVGGVPVAGCYKILATRSLRSALPFSIMSKAYCHFSIPSMTARLVARSSRTRPRYILRLASTVGML